MKAEKWAEHFAPIDVPGPISSEHEFAETRNPQIMLVVALVAAATVCAIIAVILLLQVADPDSDFDVAQSPHVAALIEEHRNAQRRF